MKAKLLAVLIMIGFIFIQTVSGDIAPFNPEIEVEIQGAKIVSEGAYFRFELTNKIHEDIQVRITVPIEFKHQIYEEFWLNGLASIQFDLVAPYINEPYKEYQFTFKCAIGGLRTDAPIETVYFPVIVLDLSTMYSMLDNELEFEIADYLVQYERQLSAQNEMLDNQRSTIEGLTEAVQNLRQRNYRLGSLMSTIQTVLFLSFILNILVSVTLLLVYNLTSDKKRKGLKRNG